MINSQKSNQHTHTHTIGEGTPFYLPCSLSGGVCVCVCVECPTTNLGVGEIIFPRAPSLHVSKLELLQSEAIRDLGSKSEAAAMHSSLG